MAAVRNILCFITILGDFLLNWDSKIEVIKPSGSESTISFLHFVVVTKARGRTLLNLNSCL